MLADIVDDPEADCRRLDEKPIGAFFGRVGEANDSGATQSGNSEVSPLHSLWRQKFVQHMQMKPVFFMALEQTAQHLLAFWNVQGTMMWWMYDVLMTLSVLPDPATQTWMSFFVSTSAIAETFPA